MFEFINFKDEAAALTKWLISIPSVTTTSGEGNIADAVFQTLSETSYFKTHPDNLIYVPHADNHHHSITALVRTEDPEIRDTFCLLCNLDTAGNDEYGILKPYAFRSDELKNRLRSYLKNKSRRQSQLSYDNTLYGLGSFECKAVAGTLITLIKEASDSISDLPFNLLLICTTQTVNGNKGITETLPYVKSLLTDNDLELRLTLAFKPEESEAEDENKLKLYTSNTGLAEIGYYVIGQKTEITAPFAGFSPTQTAARLIEKTEFNSDLCSSKAAPFVPVFKNMLLPGRLNTSTKDSALITFDLPFCNLNFHTLIEKLKQIAAAALEDSCLALENSQAAYFAKTHEEFSPKLREAEVLSYSDLLYRASRRYRGDLGSDMEKLLERCRNENLGSGSTIHALLSKLCKLARLPKPSVIVFMGNNFVPQQQLRQNYSEDRDLYMRLYSSVEEFNKEHVQQISFSEYAPWSDCCFMRPSGSDHADELLSSECPIPYAPFYNFGAPAVTLTYRGQDLNQATEHVSTEIFELIPAFLLKIFEEFQASEATSK